MKSMLLLCALMVGNVNAWAVDVEIFNVAGGGSVPSGWTLIGADKTSYWLFDAGGFDNIKTSAYDLSAYDKATITAQVANYGQGKNAHAKIEVSYDGGNTFTEEATQGNPTSSSYVNISYELLSVSANVVIRVSNSISSGKGLRFKNFVLKGTSSKADAGLAYTTAKYATTFGVPFATPSLTNPNSLAVTYATSDAAVADVNTTTGAVTIKNKIGSATITASTEGDATHSAGNASYTIYVFEHDGSASNNAYTVSEARTFVMNELYDADASYYISGIVASVGTYYDGDKTLTYYLSDNGVNSNTVTVYKGKGLSGADFAAKADMQALDLVTLHGKFTIYNSTTPQITNSEQVYFKRKLAPELEAIADFDMYRDTEKSAESLFTIASDGEVSYESSDETVVKIVDGKLKALKVGTATITISVPATDDYNAGSDNVTVTVKNRDAVAPEGAAAGTGYFIVTDASSLEDGDNILFVGSIANGTTKAMSTNQKTNNRGVTDVTVENQEIASISGDVQVITLEKSSGKWYFNVGTGYLYAASKTSNQLKTQADKDENALATITIASDSKASVVFGGGNRRVLRYNASNELFACYADASSVQDFYIYKYREGNTFDITIGSTGYKTLISAVSATLPVGVTAYKAISAGEGKVKLTSVASIKAGSAYVLKGTPSTNYTLTVTDTPEEPTGNILEISDENTSNGVYVLANGSSGAGFYKWMGGSLGAGRVIVPASAVSGAAREYMEFSFDDDATAIEAVKAQNIENSEFFDLQGRCVAQPTKGLYIVNGKKVIVK